MADLARVQESTLEFNAEQRQMIRDAFANGATDQEFAVLMEVARARRLNPLTKQIHFVKRWDSEKNRWIWSAQISIDGLRAVAERTGVYDGQDEPEFIYDEHKKLTCAKVRIWRKGIARPFVGVAHFSEYVQLRQKDRQPTSFWANKPHVMLAKCAEALGIRKGFPEDTSGLYVPEEMGQQLDEIVGEVIDQTTGEVTHRVVPQGTSGNGVASPIVTQARSTTAATVAPVAPPAPSQAYADFERRLNAMKQEDDAKVIEIDAKKAHTEGKLSRADLLRLSSVSAQRKRWLRGETPPPAAPANANGASAEAVQ